MLTYEKMTENDVPELTGIMKRAFDKDSQAALGCDGGPEGYDDGSFLRKWGIEEGGDARKILRDGKTVGGYILFFSPDGKDGFLGTIFVDPDLHEQGIGTKVWKDIEIKHPDVAVWHTETPGFSRRNHAFYVNKCGFSVVHIENARDPQEVNYRMEKRMK